MMRFLARDAFVRTYRRAIAMMFIRLSVCLSVYRTDLSLWLDSPIVLGILTRKHVHPLPAVFSRFHLEERWGMDVQTIGVISQERLKIEVKLILSPNRKSYMPRRLAQQRMTLSDLEWPFHPHRALSLW